MSDTVSKSESLAILKDKIVDNCVDLLVLYSDVSKDSPLYLRLDGALAALNWVLELMNQYDQGKNSRLFDRFKTRR